MAEDESTAPVADMTAEQRKEALSQMAARDAVTAKAAVGIKVAQKAGHVPDPIPGLRVFISPQHPNTSFLVKGGTLVTFRDPNSPTGKRDVSRDGDGGDIWAEFHNGVLATDDPEVIAWCEAHGPYADLHVAYHKEKGTDPRRCQVRVGLCCDASNPMAEAWAEFKSAQVPLANREATMPPGIDVDKILTGGQLTGHTGGQGEALVRSAKATGKAGRAAKGEEDEE